MKKQFLAVFTLAIFAFIGCADNNSSDSVNYFNVSDFEKPCAGGSQCDSKRCIEMNDMLACSMYCYGQGECPDLFYCAFEEQVEPTEESETSEPRGLCRPIDNNEICHSCSNDTQCDVIGGFCQRVGQGNYCLMSCDLDNCPTGFTCTPGDGGLNFCIPDTDDCTCNTIKAGTIRSCSLSNEYGECAGVITCQGDGGWTNCQGEMPGPESCDGIDNNCDGNIDEDLLGTESHCSMCGDICMGSGLPGTQPVCIESSCSLDCYEDYFDANDNSQDGCECIDDTEAVHSIDDLVSLGSWTDCDFTTQITTSLIPGSMIKTGAPDYFSFNYNRVTFCMENLYVNLKIYSSGVAHRMCVSSAGDTVESNWSCVTVEPGTNSSISPYNNDGNYYIKIELANPGDLNCMPYELKIIDD
jgi:hypothetical protein